MRPPRYSDGPAWQTTCRREADRLAHTLGSSDETWDESTSLTAWSERLRHQRSAARHGLAVAFVAAHDDGRIAGEVSFAIDARTGAAEASIWLSHELSREARTWVIAMALLRIFSLPDPVSRVIAPVSTANPGPGGLFAALGFTRRVHAKGLRWYDGTWHDHDIWWLDSDTALLQHLGALLATIPQAPALTVANGGELKRPSRRGALTLAAVARAHLRAARRWRPLRAPGEMTQRVLDGVTVFAKTNRLTTVLIDGSPQGVAHVQYEPGTSTLEAWSRLETRDAADAFVAALLREARKVGARRVAWNATLGGVEQAAAMSAGLSREGPATSPVWDATRPHEVFAAIAAEPG